MKKKFVTKERQCSNGKKNIWRVFDTMQISTQMISFYIGETIGGWFITVHVEKWPSDESKTDNQSLIRGSVSIHDFILILGPEWESNFFVRIIKFVNGLRLHIFRWLFAMSKSTCASA